MTTRFLTPVIPAKAGIHLRPPRSVTGGPPSPSLTTASPSKPKPNDTVASALYRLGQRIFSRSFKYHRPRGLLCAAGRCPNCMMNVDGTPNVRACTQPVQDGMQVTHQNAYPSLESDFHGCCRALCLGDAGGILLQDVYASMDVAPCRALNPASGRSRQD